MTNKEIYKMWAPNDVKWTNWVRPVPFISIGKDNQIYELTNFELPNIDYIENYNENVAIIVDLPGCDSIKEGIALAKKGFRPIPAFNGTNEQIGAQATVNSHILEAGLIRGVSELEKIELSKDALPAFLIDTNRLNRFRTSISIFDNSWDIYSQDLPTGKYLLENNINKVIVRGDTIKRDLKNILYKYQKEKIKIFFTNGYEKPKEVHINKLFIKEEY